MGAFDVAPPTQIEDGHGDDRSAESATNLVGVKNPGLLQHPMGRYAITINRGLAIATLLAAATLGIGIAAWAAPYVQSPDCPR
jgi:hypothetical protein